MPDSTPPHHHPTSEETTLPNSEGPAAEAGAMAGRASPDNSVLWDLDGTMEQPHPGPQAHTPHTPHTEVESVATKAQPAAQAPAPSTPAARGAEPHPAAPGTKPSAASPAAEGKPSKDGKGGKKAKHARAQQRPAEAKAPKTATAASTGASDGASMIGKYGAAGILCVTAGVAFAVGPQISQQVAQTLAPLGNLQVHAGTLIICGIALIGVGVLRRMLSGLRDRVVSVGNETQPLKQLARDNETLRRDVLELRATSNALRAKLDSIQGNTKAWNDSVKESNDALVSQINQLDAMLRGQNKSWRSALEAGLQDASARTGERFDQGLEALRKSVDAEIERRQDVVPEGLALLADSTQQAAHEGARALQDLRNHVEGLIERQSTSSSESLAALETRLDRLDQERASNAEQLGEKLERGFAAGSQALHELRMNGERAQSEAAARGTDMELRLTEELETRLEQLDHAQSQGLMQFGDRMHAELARESEAMQHSARANAELARQEAAELVRNLEQRLGAAMQQRHDAVSGSLAAVAESAHQAALEARAAAAGPQELRDYIEQRLTAQSESHVEGMVELGAQIEEALLAHTDVLAGELMAVAGLGRETSAALRELVTAPAREASPLAPVERVTVDSPAEPSAADFDLAYGAEPPFASGIGDSPHFGTAVDRNDAAPGAAPRVESSPINDRVEDIPPALPRAVESQPASEHAERLAGDPELGFEHDSDARPPEPDPSYGPNSHYGF
jgi:hypothetical protein